MGSLGVKKGYVRPIWGKLPTLNVCGVSSLKRATDHTSQSWGDQHATLTPKC